MSEYCSISALPPPSSPVLNVTISAITFPEDQIQFDFSWEPPTSTNGDVTEYLACLSSRMLEDEEDPPRYGSDGPTCVNIIAVIASITYVTISLCFATFLTADLHFICLEHQDSSPRMPLLSSNDSINMNVH